MSQHWSDCALHDGPARKPGWCSCGGYGRVSFLEKLAEFVRMRWHWYRGTL